MGRLLSRYDCLCGKSAGDERRGQAGARYEFRHCIVNLFVERSEL